jgi:hypothetical protein
MTVFQNFQTVFRIQEILYGQGLGSLYLLVSGRQLQSVLPGSTAVLPSEIAIEVFRIGKTAADTDIQQRKICQDQLLSRFFTADSGKIFLKGHAETVFE